MKEKVMTLVQKTENMDVRICDADHVAPLYQQKLAVTSPTSSSRSVGVVHLWTKGHRVCIVFVCLCHQTCN
jgi:hypothetical protein